MATLKPPSAGHRTSSSTPTGPPKAPVKADATATIADTAVFQGTHPVSIGAGTVIHPRARFYAYEGPISIGDGCIISEKAAIGAAPTPPASKPTSGFSSPSSPTSTSDQPQLSSSEISTRISYFVIIGPLATIHPGAHIHSSAIIETLAAIHRRAEIGAHTKIAAGCEIADGASVPEWVVVWGSAPGQRRKRTREAKMPPQAVVAAAYVAQDAVPEPAPQGKMIEDARLMVLQKEREVLSRMIVPAGGGRKR
ncbi:hypothetical protein NUU61_008282 [Penicillium alfredii]|uniref:Dynactin subunit 6 n=1 Tax=Penicillium alfredii TaxID=1506179 RepID=A0A9W9ESD4_9EURO|nr:uncharacterized protein NUU61_008282 [Penicillium alfredii]KAJ5086975.1 hypothetical protein NUU61_008282 [Penicillium alfredii]